MLNDLENIDQGQWLLHTTHSVMLVIICAKYGKNTIKIALAEEKTQDVPYFSSFSYICVFVVCDHTEKGYLKPHNFACVRTSFILRYNGSFM